MEKLPTHLGPVEALKLALEKEIEAYNMYQELLRRSNNRSVIDTVTFLADQEYKHRLLIEEKIQELIKE